MGWGREGEGVLFPVAAAFLFGMEQLWGRMGVPVAHQWNAFNAIGLRT